MTGASDSRTSAMKRASVVSVGMPTTVAAAVRASKCDSLSARSPVGRAGGPEAFEGLGATADRLRPRHPHDPLAVSLQQRLAFDVVFAGEAVLVPLGAVGLDDEALLRPAEVGDHAPAVDGQWPVDVRGVKSAGNDEVEDGVL